MSANIQPRTIHAEAVRATKRELNALTMPAAGAVRSDAKQFRRFPATDAATARTATLFARGLQKRNAFEFDLGSHIAVDPSVVSAPGSRPDREVIAHSSMVFRNCPELPRPDVLQLGGVTS